jgi:DNA polymerase III sliding clamp (beta) subunit (PCNA family)
MKEFKVPAKLIKAAMLNQGQRDVRYYLNGIYIDKEKGRVCGTNGHTLFVGNHESFSDFDESVILRISGTIPARAVDAHFVKIDEGCGYIYFTGASKNPVEAGNGCQVRFFYDVIEGKFPDVDILIKEKELVAVDKIGLNPEYLDLLNKISKCVGSQASIINFRGNREAIEFKLMNSDYDCKYIVMPMRI